MKNVVTLILFFVSGIGFSQSAPLKKAVAIAYEFEKTEHYSEAKKVFQDYLRTQKIAESEVLFVTNYIRLYDFILTEHKDIKKLDSILNALRSITKRNTFEADLVLKTYGAYYRFYFDKENCGKALEIALEGKKLQDFNKSAANTRITYLSDLGKIYRECKNPFEAISYYTKSLDLNIASNGEIHSDIANEYNNLGDAYIENYNPTKANECYKKAISILEKTATNNPENIDQLLIGYRNLTRSLLAYGALEEAKKYVSKLNALFFKKNNQFRAHSNELFFHARQMQIQSNVLYFAATANFEKASKYCDSLKVETKFDTKNIEAINFVVNRYYDVVDYLYDYEDFEKTIKYAQQLEPIIDKYDLIVPKMLVNAKLGTSYEKLKEYKKALHHIEIAEKIVDQQHFNSSKFSIQIIKAIILSGLNKNQEAIAISKSTLEQLVLEKTKKNITVDKIKFEDVSELADTYFINIFEKVADLYVKKFKLSKQKKDIEIAKNLYQISGKLFQEYYLKGEFNDYLSYYHQEIVEGILEVLLLDQSNFQEKIKNINLIERNASQHLLKEFDKKIKRRTAANAVDVAKVNNLKIEIEFYKKQNTTEKEQVNFNTNKILALQKEIDKLSTKISETEKNYFKFNATTFDVSNVMARLKTDEQLLKYYVCNNTVYAVVFTSNAIEIKRIGDNKVIENQVKRYGSKTNRIDADFKADGSAMNSTLMPFSLKKRITIIPDNFLNYLPFEAFYNVKQQAYVIEKHLVSYDYSLPMWLLHQEHTEKNYYQNLAAFAPFYAKPSSIGKRSVFKELKFASVESQNIVTIFGGTLFEKEKATKTNFIKEKENFDIFHLSMHSQLFEDDFNKSSLLFANNEKLFFSELYGMTIPATMVVLSACDTGNGALKSGEGIMSMSRALTYAGVKSAVVSLWQVPDKETSEIMVSFYENLKKGQPKDQALANSKRSFIAKNPMKNHPFYWAGFVINGDVSPIISPNYWIWILGSIVIISLIFIYFRFKKQKITLK